MNHVTSRDYYISIPLVVYRIQRINVLPRAYTAQLIAYLYYNVIPIKSILLLDQRKFMRANSNDTFTRGAAPAKLMGNAHFFHNISKAIDSLKVIKVSTTGKFLDPMTSNYIYN